MEQHAAEGGRQKIRQRGLVLNQLQVGLTLGFVTVALLIVFSVGVLLGMWYQASAHLPPYADAMVPTAARVGQGPEGMAHEPGMTFYSALTAPEPSPAALTVSPPKATPSTAAEAPRTPEVRLSVDTSHRDVILAASKTSATPAVRPLTPPLPPRHERVESKVTPALRSPTRTPRAPSRPSTTHYSIQVGSFRVVEDAEKLRQRLIQKGYEARVRLFQMPGQGLWYRVRVGRFSERAAAEQTARRLHAREHMPVMVAVETP
ncbi:MAG: SPOR domain-containing protein [Candidatus Tectomicrobia bacterium]